MIFVRWIGLIGMLLALVAPQAAMSQSADAYFHRAAQQYVEGSADQARETVERGLEVAPSDARLEALLEKLNQEGQSRGGGSSSGDQGQDGDTPGDDPSERADQSEQTQQDQGSEAARGDPTDRQRESRQPSRRPQSQRQSQNDVRPSGPGANRPARSPNVLSRAQANRLLQALEIQEKRLLRQLRVRDLEQVTVEKDW